jgi:hypothetical protein
VFGPERHDELGLIVHRRGLVVNLGSP